MQQMQEQLAQLQRAIHSPPTSIPPLSRQPSFIGLYNNDYRRSKLVNFELPLQLLSVYIVVFSSIVELL